MLTKVALIRIVMRISAQWKWALWRWIIIINKSSYFLIDYINHNNTISHWVSMVCLWFMDNSPVTSYKVLSSEAQNVSSQNLVHLFFIPEFNRHGRWILDFFTLTDGSFFPAACLVILSMHAQYLRCVAWIIKKRCYFSWWKRLSVQYFLCNLLLLPEHPSANRVPH